MTTVQEIEAAIAELPPQEFQEVARWVEQRRDAAWDCQIEADAHNGNLDAFYAKLMAEDGDGPKLPLHEVLDDPELS